MNDRRRAWVYTKSADVFMLSRLNPVVAYLRWCRYSITKTTGEFRGTERKCDSPSRTMWWEQEMDLEDEDDRDTGGEREGVFTRRFYVEAGNVVDATRLDKVPRPDPQRRPMDRPTTTSKGFTRKIDLEG